MKAMPSLVKDDVNFSAQEIKYHTITLSWPKLYN